MLATLNWDGKPREIEVKAVIDDIAIHRPFNVDLATGVVGYNNRSWTASHIPTGTKLVSLITRRDVKLDELKRWARLVQDAEPAAWAVMSTFEFGKSKLEGDERDVGTLIIAASRAAWEKVR